jgi:glycosyltransferase involved in cell wall biosynthesis
MAQPRAAVSVAISTRDRAAVLARCLDALLAGDTLPAEIVVVDQSRDDATRQVVAERQGRGVALVYVRHRGDGLGVSQNIAIGSATSPVVAVTDDDCVPTPGWLAMVATALGPDSPLDAVSGRILPYGPPARGRYPVALRTRTEARPLGPRAMPWEIGSGNNFAVRRPWLLRIGGNDERLGPGAPGQGAVDMDLFYRLLRGGARIRYEPALLVYHEQTDWAGRVGRAVPYGYGMGACSVLWLRQGDGNAPRVLARWLLLRATLLAAALRQGDMRTVYEELLVLRGTLGGLVHGLRLASPVPPPMSVAEGEVRA